MSKLHKVLLSAAFALSLVALVLASNNPVSQNFGSVIQGGEYIATSTKNYAGTSLASQLLSSLDGCSSTCPATLGSVVITGAAAGAIHFYDATTSNVNLRVGATSSLRVVSIPASTAAGTYTFDVNFNNGLLYDAGATVPTSTITWRAR